MAWVDANYARSVVKQIYPNDTWRRRVRGMSDEQVLAIYYKYEEKKAYSVRKEKAVTVDTVKEPVRESFISDYAEQLSFVGVL